MKLQKNRMGGAGRSKIGGKREYEDKQHEAGREPVNQSRGRIKDPWIEITVRAHSLYPVVAPVKGACTYKTSEEAGLFPQARWLRVLSSNR
jgi:hypothetical protein